MSMVARNRQYMPCPSCGDEQSREGCDTRSVDVPWNYECNNCGWPLKLFVPLFAANAQPFGWRWIIHPLGQEEVGS
jgi:predicted RNA-binding Zn-ribbon protein involved in translation (DUF1610 family)